jgi:hypothetical protein
MEQKKGTHKEVEARMGAERKEGDVAPDQFIENHFCK